MWMTVFIGIPRSCSVVKINILCFISDSVIPSTHPHPNSYIFSKNRVDGIEDLSDGSNKMLTKFLLHLQSNWFKP